MPQVRRGPGTSLGVWAVVRLESRRAVRRNGQWKEKPEEKYGKEEERRQEGSEGREERGKRKLHVRRKGKVVEKSENPWYFTLTGTC